MDDCTNPSKPCRVHDHEPEWHIVIGRRRIRAGWGVGLLVLIIALSTLPGLN